ncbi:MAG: ABC transporter permease [Puniceicoccales bacterium]|nr:ABC transporter permease [Puniceicoccales bacterium]
MWLVLTLTFVMLRYVPGGPFDDERELPGEIRIAMEAYYGDRDSLISQYGNYMGKILHGDLGPSYRQIGWSVGELLQNKMRTSFTLGACALILSIAIGITVGLMQAVAYGKWWDRLLSGAEVFLICMPAYVVGPILCYVFVYKFHIFPAFGWGNLRSAILPLTTLVLYYSAFIGRLTRQSMAEQRTQLYVRTAMAKGLSPWKIFKRHIFFNGIQPVIAYLGPCSAGVLSGIFVIENLFNIPGMGRLFIQAIGNRDYTVIGGILIIYASLVVIFNLIADLLLLSIDPRISLQREK